MPRIYVTTLAAILCCFFAGSSSLHAVVRNDDKVGNPGDFPVAVKIVSAKGEMCSGTVICGGQYIITAKHCITSPKGSLLGGDWTVTNTAGKEIKGTGDVRVHATADIAIICLDGKFDKWAELYCGETDNMEVCFTGFGLSSDKAGGDGGGPGTGKSELPFGTPRTGYNILDRGKQPGLGADQVAFDFDWDKGKGAGGLGDREGTTFGGDSGMGWLKQVDSTFQLLAVHGGIFDTVPSTMLNKDQVVSFGTSVQPYKEWIEAKGVPEPSTLTLLSLGAGGLLAYGWRRRRRAAA